MRKIVFMRLILVVVNDFLYNTVVVAIIHLSYNKYFGSFWNFVTFHRKQVFAFTVSFTNHFALGKALFRL